MSRKVFVVGVAAMVAIVVLEFNGCVHIYAQSPLVLKESVLVQYHGLSWAGGGRPALIPGIVLRPSVPECRLTTTEQKTLTCAFLFANDAMAGGVDGVVVHLSGDGITSDIFKTINGGWVQMRVKQGKRYVVAIDQPTGYTPLSKVVRLSPGQPFWQGSDALGNKTSDLLVLQLWPK